jgi:carbon-monoxide dehydrogenase medium subunit
LHAFDYVAAQTVEEAVSLLAEKGDAARVLAGGTDLIVQVREGRRSPDLIVDVKKIPDTNVLSYSPQSGLTLGAAVPCHRIYGDATIAAAYPGLVDAFSLVGGTQIQGRASVGGNLCNSSPAADTIPALIAHSAVAVIAGASGTREVAVEDFCTGPGRNVLQNGEFLVSLKIPAPPQWVWRLLSAVYPAQRDGYRCGRRRLFCGAERRRCDDHLDAGGSRGGGTDTDYGRYLGHGRSSGE